jgi:L-cysteine S-thiosulfotransferase
MRWLRSALLTLPILLQAPGALAGDPARGRAVALDPELGDCAICHQLPGADTGAEALNQGTIGPPLLALGARYDAAALRTRIADPKSINPETAMPGYGVTTGLHRVPPALAGRPILTDAEIDDVVAWLLESAP